MLGIQQPSSQRGVMYQAFEQIFEYIQNTDVTYYVVRTSYFEIYNEEIRDLLHKHNSHKLEVKEHPEKGIYVKDLMSVEVTCVEDMEEVLEVGSWNRMLGATAQNPDSSRSHCIFTVEFELCFFSVVDNQEHFRSGRLNLVDLAGSERQRHSKAEGERFREATKINLSLSALGNVISALVNDKSKHIPYRASKLTRLLQDSLGGNSRTLMIACVSPGENNYGETLSTLRYANRAKNIKNRPRVNEDPKDAMIRQYQKEIKMLRQLLSNQMRISGDTPVLPMPKSFGDMSHEELKRSAVVITKQERLAYEQRISGLQHQYDYEHLSREQFESSLNKTKGEYDTYRLKHEYKVQRLQIEYKLKIGRLEKLLRGREDDTSDESAYVSTDENNSSSASDKHDKSTLLSPVTENAHLWSYQWLKCYCDSNRKLFYDTAFHCICMELIKDNDTNEKASQTCQICMNKPRLIEHEASIDSLTDDVSEDAPKTLKNGVCCFIPFVSFFGETA